jgi:hypothetical protein
MKMVKTRSNLCIYSRLHLADKLSLKNCQAIENGYDLDELVLKKDLVKHFGMMVISTLIEGFQKALEILGDKKFSGDDIRTYLKDGIHVIILRDMTRIKSLLSYQIVSNHYNKLNGMLRLRWKLQEQLMGIVVGTRNQN